MDAEKTPAELDQFLKERFAQLPKIVQDSITSADVEEHLRRLSQIHKLHLDQWQLLENNVMLSLLGVEKIEDLVKNLQEDLGINAEAAAALASDVSSIIFEPIRAELERELELAEPQPEGEEGDAMGSHALTQAMSAAQPVIPATPPPAAPTAQVVRAPISASYAAQQPSHERKIVEGDPYREQVS